MTIRWGILGTGGIARTFTEDLLLLGPEGGHEVAAVGSRAAGTAEAFAGRYGIGRAHASYAALAADDGVDVVYVATPHNAHHSAARTCLEAGRAVLVEKPLTTCAADFKSLAALGREHGLFAIEAMWTRRPGRRPAARARRRRRRSEVTAVYADFGESVVFDAAHRLSSPDLAGGALLDLGVYPVSFAWMLRRARHRTGVSTPRPTAWKPAPGILLGYSSGAIAVLHCGFLARTPQDAVVAGEGG